MKTEETIKELDLDFSHFNCCGDEDLHPFRCPTCHWLMVFCYECETLYPKLNNLEEHGRNINHSNINKPIFACPGCGYEFEYFFMDNEAYLVPRSEWLVAGFKHLLRA